MFRRCKRYASVHAYFGMHFVIWVCCLFGWWEIYLNVAIRRLHRDTRLFSGIRPRGYLMSEFSTQEATGVEVDPDGSAAPTLRATSPLGDAIVEYEGQMVRKGFSENTIKAFANDLKILRTFMDGSAVLREIQTRHLEGFLEWMQSERGRPCSAKTLSRRITTLKVFFAWLHSVGAMGTDPAEPLIQQSVRTPLPVILNNNEAGKLMRACQDWLWDRMKSDARPYVLVSLLLQTGIKKSEAVKILLDDIERPESEEPSVFIRYEEERYAHKNRRISLNTGFLGAARPVPGAGTDRRIFSLNVRRAIWSTSWRKRAFEPAFDASRWALKRCDGRVRCGTSGKG